MLIADWEKHNINHYVDSFILNSVNLNVKQTTAKTILILETFTDMVRLILFFLELYWYTEILIDVEICSTTWDKYKLTALVDWRRHSLHIFGKIPLCYYQQGKPIKLKLL